MELHSDTRPVPGIKSEPTICLLGASYGTSNMGVNALTVGATEIMLQRWPNARILLLDYGTAPCEYVVSTRSREITIPVVNIRFSKHVYSKNHIAFLLMLSVLWRALAIKWVRASIEKANPWLGVVAQADLAVSVAAGDSFSDIYGIVNLLYVSLPQILCLCLNKKLVLLPQTYGPFKARFARWMAGAIISRADRLYSRDLEGVQACQDLLKGARVKDSAQFCHDMGILLEPHPTHDPGFDALILRKGARPLVGLNISGLLSRSGGDFARRSGFLSDYDLLIRKLVVSLIRDQGATVLLLPHVMGTGKESDLRTCEILWSELGEELSPYLGMIQGGHDHHGLKYMIASCDFFIGSRMHACIAAVSQCVPAVSLAYSKKFVGVMASMGVAELVGDLRVQNEAGIMKLVATSLPLREAYRLKLTESMPGWKTATLSLLDNYEYQRD